MEKITRQIVRDRGGFDLVYPFTTWDIVFDPNLDKPNFQKLCSHLRRAFIEGMQCREKSASTAPALMLTSSYAKDDMGICEMALKADYVGKGFRQHPIVENYLMDWHPHCFAIEVPVWNDDMCTCIDIVFYVPETDHIYLWDFKPEAKKEKKAATQVYWTKQLMHASTGIPLENMTAGYFDNKDAFILND